ncbi:hypothetical protein [Sinomicrobium weinanense]|uniref:Uncharacterized protein n=1 Tax=Sinomicrobium weinanense TaxID=2842200 RepID=A0A926Q3I8_9FLAO|nr:hypothetical protein [Sinomicrobium weinanense]MBC9796974.1 hypothetical protein [Sinomicrobium weinanense]MBU3122187.1 hypothetical protein [Sinomicrobium weinanense]
MKTLESYGVQEMNMEELHETDGGISFDQAYHDFQQGGAHLGLGAAMLVSAAWAGIALTPALILGSLGTGLLGGGIDL